MPKYIKNPIRFTREWNPKRIALIFLVQIGKEYKNGKYDVGKINMENHLEVLKEMKPSAQRDALAWFSDEWSERTFAFNWVCDTLEKSRAGLRRRILNGGIVEEIAKIQVAFID